MSEIISRSNSNLSREELMILDNSLELSKRDQEAWSQIIKNVDEAIYLTRRVNNTPSMILDGKSIRTSPHKWDIGIFGLKYEEKRAGAIPIEVDENESVRILHLLTTIDNSEELSADIEFDYFSFYKIRNFAENILDPEAKLGITLWDSSTERAVLSKTLKRSEYGARINDADKMLLSTLADRTIKASEELFREVAL